MYTILTRRQSYNNRSDNHDTLVISGMHLHVYWDMVTLLKSNFMKDFDPSETTVATCDWHFSDDSISDIQLDRDVLNPDSCLLRDLTECPDY